MVPQLLSVIVCNGACGGCPCPPPMLSRGMPPAAGGCAGGGGGDGGCPCPPPGGVGGDCPCPPPGGRLENVRLWCPPGGEARVCPRLPPVSFPAAAVIVFCCACSFVIFRCLFPNLKIQHHRIVILAVFSSTLLLAFRAGLFCL